MRSLECRAGIEGMFMIVRNNTEYQFPASWYFTAPQLDRYLAHSIKGWDTDHIGTIAEVFSIAGCNVLCELFT